jgi:hypothetical protein
MLSVPNAAIEHEVERLEKTTRCYYNSNFFWPRGLRDTCTVRSVFSEKKKLSIAALSRTCRGSLLTPGKPWRVRISHQKRERTA